MEVADALPALVEGHEGSALHGNHHFPSVPGSRSVLSGDRSFDSFSVQEGDHESVDIDADLPSVAAFRASSRCSRSGGAAGIAGDFERGVRERRLERNRLSAQASRRKRKEYIEGLERRVEELEARNKQLEDHIRRLFSDISRLKPSEQNENEREKRRESKEM